MDLNYTDEQQMLANTVADFAAKESPIERVRKLRDDEIGWSKALWKQMGDLGWLAIPFPESIGGYGGSFVEAAIVLEQMGKTLVPEPYLASVVMAGTALAQLGSESQQQTYLVPLIAGDISFGFGYAESSSRYDIRTATTSAEQKGEQFVLNGEKRWVDNGHAGDHVLVTANTPDGVGVFLVDANDDGVTKTVLNTMDSRRSAHIQFKNVTAQALGEPGSDAVSATLDLLWDLGAAACCAEGLGVAQVSFDMTLDYLKTREQFGTKIGAFQALQHRAVDMYIENQLLKAATTASTIRVTEADPTERCLAVSAAKKQLALGGKFVAQQAIQLHGGIGVTDEHDIGLYFKRLHVLNILFGDETWHQRRYAMSPAFIDANR